MFPKPNDGFRWVQVAGGPALVCEALAVPHLFTTRSWALGSASAPDGALSPAWDAVAQSLGVDAGHLCRAHQVHGASVAVRRVGDHECGGQPLADADIIVSDDPARALAIQTADCVPLLVADRRTGSVAAAHAGWKGLAAGVPRETIDALAREFGSAPPDLVAAVGPSICAERYEVGADVRARFEAAGFSTAQLARWFLPGARPDHWLFDGWRSAHDQLAAAGVRPERVHIAALCTAEYPDFFCSYRRDGNGAGRIGAAIRAVTPGWR